MRDLLTAADARARSGATADNFMFIRADQLYIAHQKERTRLMPGASGPLLMKDDNDDDHAQRVHIQTLKKQSAIDHPRVPPPLERTRLKPGAPRATLGGTEPIDAARLYIQNYSLK